MEILAWKDCANGHIKTERACVMCVGKREKERVKSCGASVQVMFRGAPRRKFFSPVSFVFVLHV